MEVVVNHTLFRGRTAPSGTTNRQTLSVSRHTTHRPSGPKKMCWLDGTNSTRVPAATTVQTIGPVNPKTHQFGEPHVEDYINCYWHSRYCYNNRVAPREF